MNMERMNKTDMWQKLDSKPWQSALRALITSIQATINDLRTFLLALCGVIHQQLAGFELRVVKHPLPLASHRHLVPKTVAVSRQLPAQN
jgi:hypothetical protein